jgi:hypothetical protein
MVKIIDNLLPSIFINKLDSLFNGPDFPWYFVPKSINTDNNNNQFMFVHSILGDEIAPSGPRHFKSPFYDLFEPILYYVDRHLSVNKLIRMKLNLYTNQHQNIIHTSHYDFTDDKKPANDVNIALFNFTTCNGGTIINDKKYSSVRNQLLIFDNTCKHAGVTQTDTQRRIIMNIGWYKNG